MSKITLLKLEKVTYETREDLERLIKYHQEQLDKVSVALDSPNAIVLLNAIAYNLIHLTRRLEHFGNKKAKLYVFPGERP